MNKLTDVSVHGGLGTDHLIAPRYKFPRARCYEYEVSDEYYYEHAYIINGKRAAAKAEQKMMHKIGIPYYLRIMKKK